MSGFVSQDLESSLVVPIPILYYCSCEAGPVQMEIDCLQESIQYAIHQASEESKEFVKMREDQQREIDILNAKIKESKERGDKFRRQYKDTKKGLEEVKTRIIHKSRSGSSLSSFTSSTTSVFMSRSSSWAGFTSSKSSNPLHNSSFALVRPSKSSSQLNESLSSLSARGANGSGSNPFLQRAYQLELNLPSLNEQDASTRLAEMKALKLRLEARDKEIANLEGLIDGNFKMIKLLQEKSVKKKNEQSF